MKKDNTKVCIRRGDIFVICLGSDSSKESLVKPVLVIQNDIGNRFCSSIIVVPLIPEILVRKLLFSIRITANNATGLDQNHIAIFSQIRTVDKACFANDCYLGRLNEKDTLKMDKAIELSLGLSALQKLHNRRYKAASLE
jgi:mRNA interferase MazF